MLRLFCLPLPKEQMDEFLKENYISLHWDWLNEDLELVSWEQICGRYEKAARSENLRLFVDTMQDGDFIIISDGTRASLGDLGDYYYVDDIKDKDGDNAQCIDSQATVMPSSHHRRGVTWMKRIAFEQMDASLQHFLAARSYRDLWQT